MIQNLWQIHSSFPLFYHNFVKVHYIQPKKSILSITFHQTLLERLGEDASRVPENWKTLLRRIMAFKTCNKKNLRWGATCTKVSHCVDQTTHYLNYLSSSSVPNVKQEIFWYSTRLLNVLLRTTFLSSRQFWLQYWYVVLLHQNLRLKHIHAYGTRFIVERMSNNNLFLGIAIENSKKKVLFFPVLHVILKAALSVFLHYNDPNSRKSPVSKIMPKAIFWWYSWFWPVSQMLHKPQPLQCRVKI